MANSYPKIRVDDMQVSSMQEALLVAENRALRSGVKVFVMEKLDAMTPWHVLKLVEPKEGAYYDSRGDRH